MGLAVTKAKFNYAATDEPHATRRKEILMKHPEIKQLFGIDPAFKWVVAAQVLTMTIIAVLLRDASWPHILLQAYFTGGTFIHSLTLAVHEISHNQAFGIKRPLANRLFGMLANLPMGVPMSVTFKKYHLEHHRYLGVDSIDTDVPTELEAQIFNTTFRKIVWLFLQPLFYGFRPMVVYNKAVTDLEIINLFVQLAYDALILYFGGWKSLVFLLASLWLGMGLHPLSGHYISDHYVFRDGQETNSYYGVLNLVTFNVGYHNEHHDFPFVPGSKLPEISRMAPEFYENLNVHDSCLKMFWKFITDPEMGLRSRTKRAVNYEPEYYGAYSCKINRFFEKVLGVTLLSEPEGKKID